MSYKFVRQPLASGLYEPEGVYLSAPFTGQGRILQTWGANPAYYAQFKYNGTSLRGHIGIDFGLSPETALLAVDQGRVMEISYEPDGFERYIKIEHHWGESFYAYVGDIVIESGQLVGRGDEIGVVDAQGAIPYFHFAIRIFPYNRFDGWGGFSDPLPFMDPSSLLSENEFDALTVFEPPAMAVENQGMRRP
jgi:murein DD-endopeptidase MepM/ murein hydrolase activator NlpD